MGYPCKIDSYSFGRIVVDGKTYSRDVLIFPKAVHSPWYRAEGHVLAPKTSWGIAASSTERRNLSIRNYERRFCRRTIRFSKDGDYSALYLEILHAWFIFIKLHEGLKLRKPDGSYARRAPAMAQGLAVKPLTWQDILRWRRC